MLAVFAVKLLVLVQLNDHPLLQPIGELDPAYYVDLARQVAAGHDAPVGQAFFVSPLYVYFLAAIFALTGGSLLVARTAQVLLGTVAVYLIWRMASEWFGTRAAWFACAFASACGLFAFYEILLLQAALDPFLTALALWTFMRGCTATRLRWWLASGVSVGLLALNRPNALAYVLPALVALVIAVSRSDEEKRRDVRRKRAVLAVACYLCGIALTLVPVTVRNYRESGDLVVISSHGGLNFYIGNNADADGTFHRVEGITPSIAGQERDASRVVAEALGHEVGPSEVSRYYYRLAGKWIAAHPREAAQLFVRKLRYVFNAAFLTLNYSYPYYSGESAALRALAVGPWLLLPLGLVGLFAPRRPARDRRAGLPLAYVGWAAFVPVYALSVAVFFVSSRYRMPLLVPLAVSSGALIDWVVGLARAQRRRTLGVVIVTLAAVSVATNWNLRLDNGLSAERTKMVRYLVDTSQHEEAARLLALTEREHPHPAVLLYTIGQEYLRRGDASHAIPLLERALALEPDRPEAGLLLGQALLRSGRPVDAVVHLKAAVDSGHGGASAYDGLGLALGMLGRGGEAAQALETASRLDPANAQTHLNLAVVYANLGRLAEARKQAEDAIRLDPDYARARELLNALPK